ncbi:hypothetical protein F5887DRAFT_650253 [Amanita rubescens]|nr:hypothetical protein F5887DRAFT_650253 [Amanita rubescens]
MSSVTSVLPQSAETATAVFDLQASRLQRTQIPDNQTSVSTHMQFVQCEFTAVAGNYNRYTNQLPDDVLKDLCDKDSEDRAEFGRVKDDTIAYPDAGQWILQRQEYKMWKQGQLRLLWLKGIPGAGKTVLTSVVIEDVKGALGCQYIYGFCDQLNGKKRKPTNLLCSLLGQLLKRTSTGDPKALSILRNQCEMKSLFQIGDLTNLIMELSPATEKTFVVIDGLDKCDSLDILLPHLLELAKKLYVFVSSRDHPDIRHHFQDQTHYMISADDIRHDVQQFVKMEVEKISRINPDVVDFIDFIVDSLTSGAEGTFLWPLYHIEELKNNSLTAAEIKRSPEGLPQSFENMVKREFEAIHDRFHLVLKLVLCAKRPLTLLELAEGVATDKMERVWNASNVVENPMLLVDRCANLLVCFPHPERDMLQIVAPFHESVKRSLLAGRNEPKRSKTFYRPDVHIQLARLCLTYLKLKAMREFPSLLSDISDHPFAEYAITGWLDHIRASGTAEMAKEFQEFLAPGSATFEIWRHLFAGWSGTYASSKVLDHLEYLDPAHLAVWFNLPKIIPQFSSDQLCTEDYRGLSTLHVAMEISSFIDVQVITSLLPEVDVDQVTKDGNTALHIAASHLQSNGRVVDKLCEAGAEVDKPDKEGRTPLHLAMLNPGTAMPCIIPLLSQKADPNALDSSWKTPLHIAAAAPGYVTNRQSGNHRAQTVAEYQRGMKALLTYNADVQSMDRDRNTPLHLAASVVNPFGVQLLLKNGAFVDTFNGAGYTPLHLAINCNLLNTRWSILETPELRDQRLTIEHLLRHSADVNKPSKSSADSKGSSLHLAARSCCNEVIFTLLIKHGAFVDSQDAEGATPFHRAAAMAPIKNPNEHPKRWSVSWMALRQIICKLLSTAQCDLSQLQQIAEAVLGLIMPKYPNTAPILQEIDSLEPEHPFATWFEHVREQLCSAGAQKVPATRMKSPDVLTFTMKFWSSWIHSNIGSISSKRAILYTLYSEWTRISKLLQKP